MAFWLWSVLVFVLFVTVFACLSHIRVRVRYSRSGQLDQLVIVFQAVYGLIRYQVILPSIVMRGLNVVYNEKRSGSIPGIGEHKHRHRRIIGRGTVKRYAKAYRVILRNTRMFKQWARQTLKKIECTRWRLDFRVGTGDAASTAVVTGLLWAVSGCAAGAASQFLRLKASPHSQVSPNYSATEFTVVWEADFRIRLGSVVWAILKLGKRTVHATHALRAWRSWLSSPSEA
jgi:hypothetical protein